MSAPFRVPADTFRSRPALRLPGWVLCVAMALPAVALGQPVDPPPASQGGDDWDVIQGAALYEQGERDAARQKFDAVLVRDPQNTTALYYLGLYHMDRGLSARKQEVAVTDEAERVRLRVQAGEAFALVKQHLGTLLDLAQSRPRESIERLDLVPFEAGLTLAQADLADRAADEQAAIRSALRLLRGAPGDPGSGYVATHDSDYVGHFFLGIALFRMATAEWSTADEKTQSRGEAAAAFKRVIELLGQQADVSETERDAVRIYVAYYEGAVCLVNRDYAGARRRFDEVVAQAPPELAQLRDNARFLSERAANPPKVGPATITLLERPVGPLELRGSVSAGVGHDTNVILLGENTTRPRNIGRDESVFGEASASLELSRKFTKEEDGWKFGESLRLGIGGDTTHRWYERVEDFNLNQYRGRVFVEWELPKAVGDDVYFYSEYLFANTLLGREPFIDGHNALFGITKIWSDRERESYGTRTGAYYAYEYRNYSDSVFTPALDRDGNYHLIGVQQAFDLVRADALWAGYYQGKPADHPESKFDSKRWLNAFVGYEYRDERTQGKEFDLNGHALLFGVDVPLPWRLAFDYSLRLSWDDYNNTSIYDYQRRARSDLQQRHGVGLTYTIVSRGELEKCQTLQVKLRGFLDFTDQDSNVIDSQRQALYSYDRYVAGLQLGISF
ncbi:MAG: hypothetical protein AB7Q17_14560 [Phycisphaerae bacterium]